MPYGVLGTVGARRSRPGLLRPSAGRLPAATANYTLTVGGVDMTPFLLTHTPVVRATGYAENATFKFKLHGPPTGTPLDGIEVEQEVRWNDGTRDVFAGTLRSVEPSDINRHDRHVLSCDCQTFTTLLDDNVVTAGSRAVTAESDGDRVKWLIDTFCTTGLTYAHVQDLVLSMPAFDYTGMTLNEAVGKVLEQSRGLYAVDYEKDLHTFLEERKSAPFNVSNAANDDTTFRYAPGSLTWPKDSVSLRNAVYAIPAAGGTGVPTWYEDLQSILYYGRREAVLKSTNKDQVDLDAEANAALQANRYPYGAGSFVCFQPGLEAGMDIGVTSVLYGIWNQRFRIQAVETTYPVDATGPGGTGAQYRVEFGNAPFALKAQAISLSAGAKATARFKAGTTFKYSDLVAADGPVGWWRLGESRSSPFADPVAGPTAAVFNDSAGTNHLGATGFADGVNKEFTSGVAGAISGDANTAAAKTDAGQISYLSARNIGGPGNHVNDPAKVYDIADDFTMEAWVKPADGTPIHGPNGTVNIVMLQWGAGNTPVWGMALLRPGAPAAHPTASVALLYGLVSAPSGVAVYDPVAPTLTLEAWSHLVIRRAAGVWYFYVNGSEVGTPTGVVPARGTEIEPFFIGGFASSDQNNFAGALDEVAVYPTALHPSRIRLHYGVGIL